MSLVHEFRNYCRAANNFKHSRFKSISEFCFVQGKEANQIEGGSMISEIIKSAAPILDKFVEDKDAKANKGRAGAIYYRTTSSSSSCNVAQAKHSSLLRLEQDRHHGYVLWFNDTVFSYADSWAGYCAVGSRHTVTKLQTGELMSLTWYCLGWVAWDPGRNQRRSQRKVKVNGDVAVYHAVTRSA